MRISPIIFSMTPTDKILALLRGFPCLRDRFCDWAPHEFDPDIFYDLCSGMSHGEMVSALFILNVWNPDYARKKGWVFDTMEFAQTADMQSRAAFLSWMADPVWP